MNSDELIAKIKMVTRKKQLNLIKVDIFIINQQTQAKLNIYR